MTQRVLVLDAPAKVNLTMEVLGRRPDGYHDICSVMQAITLADRLTFRPATDLTLQCDQPTLEGPANLAWRAADLLRRATGCTAGVEITLEKHIPVAAGLGGGSSDGATALRALNQLWELNLPRAGLMELGAQLGADVPFFLVEGGCALAEGRGDRLTPLEPLPPRWLILVTPPIGISAGTAYAAYAALPQTSSVDGTRTRAWLFQARDANTVPPPFNHLEPAALRVAPQAAAARDALLAAGAPFALMSGSGSTYFTLLEDEASASTVRERIASDALKTYIARFVPA